MIKAFLDLDSVVRMTYVVFYITIVIKQLPILLLTTLTHVRFPACRWARVLMASPHITYSYSNTCGKRLRLARLYQDYRESTVCIYRIIVHILLF